MTAKGNIFIGMMTVTVLFFGGGSVLLENHNRVQPDSTQYMIGGLFLVMGTFRLWRLVFDAKRARKRKQ